MAARTMAAHKQSKILVDLAADSSSSHELSFAGLLSIQDIQQPKHAPIKSTYNIQQEEQDFEFSSVIQHPEGLGSSKGYPSDTSICRGQIQLQTLLYQSTQFQVASKPTHCNNKAPNTHSNGNDRKVAQKSNYGKEDERKDRAPRASFGQKILQSFVSPCRECHAHKPSVREHTITRKQSKLN